MELLAGASGYSFKEWCGDFYPEKLKAVAEEATDVLEETYAAATKGSTEYGLKLIDTARLNTNAAFDFFERNRAEVAIILFTLRGYCRFCRLHLWAFQGE